MEGDHINIKPQDFVSYKIMMIRRERMKRQKKRVRKEERKRRNREKTQVNVYIMTRMVNITRKEN